MDGVGVYDMKEADIVDEIKPAASSTLDEIETTMLRKLVRNIAPVCSIYDVIFIKSAEKHKRGFEEYLSEKADSILADPSYNEGRDQKDDQRDMMCSFGTI